MVSGASRRVSVAPAATTGRALGRRRRSPRLGIAAAERRGDGAKRAVVHVALAARRALALQREHGLRLLARLNASAITAEVILATMRRIDSTDDDCDGASRCN